MKKCIVSLQVSSPVGHSSDPALARLHRLESSLTRTGYSGDLILWKNAYPPGSPLHMESPWGFKAFCFMEAKKAGYDAVLWMDSSAIAIRPVDSLFELLEKQGYLFPRNRDRILGEWCSDEVLAYCGMEREAALALSEVNAAVMGLDFRHPVAACFLEQWYAWAAEGFVFRGTRAAIRNADEFEAIKWNLGQKISQHPRVKGHRHDQTAAGILAHQLGMQMDEGYITDKYAEAYANPRTAILIDRSTHLSLRKALLRVFVIERMRAPLRKLQNWIRMIKSPQM